MHNRICILDYGSGNVRSVYNLFSRFGNCYVDNSEPAIRSATHIVLPGVGAFGSAMRQINEKIPLQILQQEIFNNGKPFLGICVGMQILADVGYEFGEQQGLGWISGEVKKLQNPAGPLPHIGWNDIVNLRQVGLFSGLQSGADFYFVHSYVFHPYHPQTIWAESAYGEFFPSVIGLNNIVGVQFHPEKSQRAGMIIAENFIGMK